MPFVTLEQLGPTKDQAREALIRVRLKALELKVPNLGVDLLTPGEIIVLLDNIKPWDLSNVQANELAQAAKPYELSFH